MAGVVIADIGGTTSRFALADGGRPGEILRIPNDEHDGPETLIEAALAGLGGSRPATAVLALAGPMSGGDVALTNRPWVFRHENICRRFRFDRLVFVNDFEAIGHALPALAEGDVTTLVAGEDAPAGPKLALGPGTGLGAAVHWPGEPPRVTPTEAGHMSFGPSTAEEEAVFAALRERLGFVSAEAILSGPGLARLHLARSGEGECDAATIGARLAAGDDGCGATMRLFTRLLGRFAGDLALAYRAQGGVYLAGGVAQRLRDHLDVDVLRAAFTAHPPYEALLERIPIRLILAEEPGLIGCAAIAHSLEG